MTEHTTQSGLLARWVSACRGAGGTAQPGQVEAAGVRLLHRWAQPHRRYHDTAHLIAVLDVVDDCAGTDRVRLAAWWHDAVYDPHATDNEQASADLAARELAGLGVPGAVVADVGRLVLLTVDHRPAPGDADGELLCDADLAVLARPPGRYADYAANIRAEYAHVPDEQFRAARAAVLRHLLSLPRLYHRPALATRWESRARTNLTTELRTLTDHPRG
ncbi:MAG TPA: metal-dependent phosphohydrolase [Actinoplanes sp.]|nr:metal-dependent phosphohydrolase [Actinoplanes sp.]